MKTNQEYKNGALAALKGNWAPAVVCTIVFMLLTMLVSGIQAFFDTGNVDSVVPLLLLAGSLILVFFLTGPLTVGYYNVFKDLLVKGENKMTSALFSIGYGNVLRNGFGIFLMGVFVVLWSILLLIPGIIKSFAYAMTPFILVDYPELSPNQAINLSIKMMKGHKFDLFWLQLSFIGWGLLGILTLGIGYFWLMPYMYTSIAAFYQDVKTEYMNTTTNH